MRRATILAGLLCLLLLPALFLAAAQLEGLGGRYWSRGVSVTSTSGCVTDVTDAGSTCALFPAGSSKSSWYNVTVHKARQGLSASITGCFTQTATGATVASGAIATDAQRGAGGGDCHTLDAAGDHYDSRPLADMIRSRPGGRYGLCAGSVYSAGDVLYPPCSINSAFADGVVTANDSRASAAECTAYGLAGASAACQGSDLWTADQTAFQGVVLLVHAASNQSSLVTKDRIQER